MKRKVIQDRPLQPSPKRLPSQITKATKAPMDTKKRHTRSPVRKDHLDNTKKGPILA